MKHVFITGGSRGIGAALVRTHLKRGYRVSVLDLEIAAAISGEMRSFVGDASDETVLKATLIEAEKQLGPIDRWIFNAGVTVVGPFHKQTSEERDRVMRINWGGVLAGCSLVVNSLKERRPEKHGELVLISSLSALLPAPFIATYAASKAAVLALGRALAEEAKMTGLPLDVKIVLPGFVETDMIHQGAARGYDLPPGAQRFVISADTAAEKIFSGIPRSRVEIFVGPGARLLTQMFAFAPSLARAVLRFFY